MWGRDREATSAGAWGQLERGEYGFGYSEICKGEHMRDPLLDSRLCAYTKSMRLIYLYIKYLPILRPSLVTITARCSLLSQYAITLEQRLLRGLNLFNDSTSLLHCTCVLTIPVLLSLLNVSQL